MIERKKKSKSPQK
jgi:hypothetical protein